MLIAWTVSISPNAQAHSASDAYLSLNTDSGAESGSAGKVLLHGQWDIALRDLDFVLKLDDDGDGNIRWGELRGHQAEIARYAYARLGFLVKGKACTVTPASQQVDNHADGAYAALFFDVACASAPKKLTLDYRLFFDIDPSHRGILVMRSGDETATALLSPENARIDLTLQTANARKIRDRPAP